MPEGYLLPRSEIFPISWPNFRVPISPTPPVTPPRVRTSMTSYSPCTLAMHCSTSSSSHFGSFQQKWPEGVSSANSSTFLDLTPYPYIYTKITSKSLTSRSYPEVSPTSILAQVNPPTSNHLQQTPHQSQSPNHLYAKIIPKSLTSRSRQNTTTNPRLCNTSNHQHNTMLFITCIFLLNSQLFLPSAPPPPKNTPTIPYKPLYSTLNQRKSIL